MAPWAPSAFVGDALVLYRNEVEGPHATALLVEALPRCAVVLELQQCGLGAGSANALAAALLPASRVVSLTLRHNRIGDDGAQVLAASLRGGSVVTRLLLQHDTVGPAGAKALAAALAAGSSLTELDLMANRIRSAGAQALAGALPASAVVTLNLGRNGIWIDGVHALAGALPCSAVTALHLADNAFQEGASSLAAALPHSRVTDLGLGSVRIGDDGVAALAAVLPDSAVARLYLGGQNDIYDEGAASLAAALSWSSVTVLDMRSSRTIGPAGRAALRAAARAAGCELRGIPPASVRWAELEERNAPLQYSSHPPAARGQTRAGTPCGPWVPAGAPQYDDTLVPPPCEAWERPADGGTRGQPDSSVAQAMHRRVMHNFGRGNSDRRACDGSPSHRYSMDCDVCDERRCTCRNPWDLKTHNAMCPAAPRQGSWRKTQPATA